MPSVQLMINGAAVDIEKVPTISDNSYFALGNDPLDFPEIRTVNALQREICNLSDLVKKQEIVKENQTKARVISFIVTAASCAFVAWCTFLAVTAMTFGPPLTGIAAFFISAGIFGSYTLNSVNLKTTNAILGLDKRQPNFFSSFFAPLYYSFYENSALVDKIARQKVACSTLFEKYIKDYQTQSERCLTALQDDLKAKISLRSAWSERVKPLIAAADPKTLSNVLSDASREGIKLAEKIAMGETSITEVTEMRDYLKALPQPK